MTKPAIPEGIDVFTTMRGHKKIGVANVSDSLSRLAAACEAHAFRGMLIFSDNSQLDPWLLAQIVLTTSVSACPLVAVQPAYTHPYVVAKVVSSLAHLHGRKVYLNMVAGGFTTDLVALGEHADHDARYRRLEEFTTIVQRLVRGDTVTFHGEFYQVAKLALAPALSPALQPGFLVSGSSDAGRQVAERIGAVAVTHPVGQDGMRDEWRSDAPHGFRLSIVTRATEQSAWDVARSLYKSTRAGAVTHSLAMNATDSAWRQQLDAAGKAAPADSGPYWLEPFMNYAAQGPVLVGSHETVAAELVALLSGGCRTFVVGECPVDELAYIAEAFQLASRP